MENKETKETFFTNALKEIKNPAFLRALMVFLCCVIISLIIGFVVNDLNLFATLGVGLGVVWMGVAYFNQKE